jgi:hypothetical protein
MRYGNECIKTECVGNAPRCTKLVPHVVQYYFCTGRWQVGSVTSFVARAVVVHSHISPVDYQRDVRAWVLVIKLLAFIRGGCFWITSSRRVVFPSDSISY